MLSQLLNQLLFLRQNKQCQSSNKRLLQLKPQLLLSQLFNQKGHLLFKPPLVSNKPNLNKRVFKENKETDLISLTTRDPTDQERESKDTKAKDIKEEVAISPNTTKEETETTKIMNLQANKSKT